MRNVCNVSAGVAVCLQLCTRVCLQLCAKMCAKVQMCKILHMRNVCNVLVGVASGVCLKRNILKMCVDVRNFALPAGHMQNVCNLLAGVASGVCLQKLVKMCVKVRMCRILHVCVQCECRCGWHQEFVCKKL